MLIEPFHCANNYSVEMKEYEPFDIEPLTEVVSPYHQTAYLNTVSLAYRKKCMTMIINDSDGKFLDMICLVLMGRKKLISLPYADSGWCRLSDKTAEAALEASLYWSRNHGYDIDIRTTTSLEGYGDSTSCKVNMLFDISRSSEEVMAGFKAKLRSQIKKPVKDGLTFKIGGVEHAEDFYSIYKENMRDLGSLPHPKKFIDALFASYGKRAVFSVVYLPNGTPAAAGILLRVNGQAVVPMASSLRRYNRSNANMLLYWSMIQFSSDSGVKTFDFGRCNVDCGTYKFKKQWGAIPHRLYWYSIHNGEVYKQLEQGKRSIVTGKVRSIISRLIQMLPVYIVELGGRLVRKEISL